MFLDPLTHGCPANEVCDFIFNPLSDKHSPTTKMLAVITVIALTILTGGIFLAVFFAFQQQDAPPDIDPARIALLNKEEVPYDGVQHGVSQYKYPVRPQNENIPQACTCISAAAIFYFSKHLEQLVAAVRSKDAPAVAQIYREIIDRGLEFWNTALEKGAPGTALHPEDLNKYVDECAQLQLDQTAVITGAIGNIEEEVEKIFAPGANYYALIQADGQSFLIFQVSALEAVLFDSHKTWAAIVSKEQAIDYIQNHILHLDINPEQSIDFFHGTII